MLDGPLPGKCAREHTHKGDNAVPAGSDGHEAQIVAEDVVTQIYRHLESLYGNALGRDLLTIDELETYTKTRMGLATFRFPQALVGYF